MSTDMQDFEEESTVTLTLDDGTELECAVVAIFPAGSNEYIALLPLEQDDEEEGEVFLYRFIQKENDEIDLVNIESDEEYELVTDAFEELLDEEEFNDMEQPKTEFPIWKLCFTLQKMSPSGDTFLLF